MPQPVAGALAGLGGMTAPICMLLVGATLADIPAREMLSRDAVLMAGIRLIVQPLIALAVLKLLHLPEAITAVTLVIVALPAASNTAVFPESFGGDYRLGSRCVALSTLLSIVTVPLLMLL